MYRAGGRSWSVRTDEGDDLAVLLAVRQLADIPFDDPSIPAPLEPAPPRIDRLFIGRRTRTAAAEPWAALWRIMVAACQSRGAEVNVSPAPPLHGIPTLWRLDPPKFGSLAAVPGLRQVMASAWPTVISWLTDLPRRHGPRGDWAAELIGQADTAKGSWIADVSVHLTTLPIGGTQHWVLAEDLGHRRLHALVSADLVTNPERHADWLLPALARIG